MSTITSYTVENITMMKNLLSTLLLAGTSVSFGQLFINEYSCSNYGGPTAFDGQRYDWAEIYNAGGAAVDLTGYYLSDDALELNKWAIPVGATVPAGGFTKVFFSKLNTVSAGEVHPDFSLTQCKGEWIILCDTDGATVMDSLKMVKKSQKNHSISRTTNGAATWGADITPTCGATNATVFSYYVPMPTMSVAPGYYAGAQNVTLTCSDAGAQIRYTTNGTTPTGASTLYAGAINISTTTVLRAIAINPSPTIPASYVETNTYFIGAASSHTMPVISVCGDQVTAFLNDVAPGSFSNNFDGHFEMFEDGAVLADEGTGWYNKHGNDSWAYDQRGFDFVMQDGYGLNYSVVHQVFPQTPRPDFQHLICKPAANDNYPVGLPGSPCHLRDAFVHTISQLGDLRLDERTSRFMIVYVDGQYWGLYDIREKADDQDYTDYYYNQPGSEIDFMKTWGGTWAEYGNSTHWDDLRTYILTGDMTDPVQYDYVKTELNIGSLIDYIVLNSYAVTSDWLNWNTAWWHGHVPAAAGGDKQKWRYVLWDNDATWGHYINYTGVPSTGPTADPCNPELLVDPGGEGHIPILLQLTLNESFKYEYVTRYIDLFNGILSCPEMHANLDSFVTEMTPEMAGQTAEWGGTVGGWNTNITALHTYFDARCAALAAGLIGCYSLSGPYTLTVVVDPPGAGEVKVNSEWVSPYPWTGTYFGGIWTIFEANDFVGFDFDYWSATSHTFANPDSLSDTLTFTANDTIVAHFVVEGTPPPPPPPPPIDPGPPPPPPATFAGFHMPNGFSPNGDSNNDWLQYFVGYDIESFDLKIFDRWGNMIFNTSSNGTYWDGIYKGKLLNTGIYTYTLNYVQTAVGKQETSGNIMLIR